MADDAFDFDALVSGGYPLQRFEPEQRIFTQEDEGAAMYVVRSGKVADAASDDEDIRGIRRMTEWLGTQKNVSATAIQTVGGKSYDGFLMAIVGGGEE